MKTGRSLPRHSVLNRRAALVGTAGLLAAPAIGRAQGQNSGVALVIGNSKYKWEASLPNVKRDAPDVAKHFQAMGLKTELLQDVGLQAMKQAVAKFAGTARGANFAAFYFAGHGATWERITYLVPEDADLSDPNAVKTLVSVPSIYEAMAEAAHRLMVFDSCRNNPADGWRQLEATRAAGMNLSVQAANAGTRAADTLALFSTAPGRVAVDGPAGENSPFAAAFMRQLANPSVDLLALPAGLRRDLLIATQGRQVVWDQSSYQQPFSLKGAGGGLASGKSGWNHDPSKIVELTNTYAFAAANNLPLPPGLIAHRPASNSPDAAKVGSFKFEISTPRGEKVPSILVVLSVEEQRTAELIWAGKNDKGFGWYFRTGTISGKRIELVVRDGAPRTIFDWSDANSGSMTSLHENKMGGPAAASFSSRFTRLDG